MARTMNSTTFSEEEINQAWNALVNEFVEDERCSKYPDQDFLEDLGDVIHDFEKCLIRKNQNQGKPYPVDNNEDGFRFDSPENLQVWFSTPQQLGELIVRDAIINYTAHNTKEKTQCIRIEGRCMEYRDVYNLKLLLNEMKSIMDIENETNHTEQVGYYMDLFRDGALLTLMTYAEEEEEEEATEEAQREPFNTFQWPSLIACANIFICKPKPVGEEEDI